jgi:hypothetical protein
MKPSPKNIKKQMNIIGGGLSTDIIKKALEKVSEIQGNTQRNELISNINSKMETAGFVPAFLDGNFKSDYVDFEITISNPASSGIFISAKNLKYNLGFVVSIFVGFDGVEKNLMHGIIKYNFKSDAQSISDM